MPAPTLDTVMRLAARHHAAGRLPEAAGIYRRVLQRDPHHAEALHALGVMAHQTGRADAAEKLLARAVAADPGLAAARDDLGSLRLLQGRPADVLAEYRQAVRLDPSLPLAHAHLGAALAGLGRCEEAVAAHLRAVDVGLTARRRRAVHIEVGPGVVPPPPPPVWPAGWDDWPALPTDIADDVAQRFAGFDLPETLADENDLGRLLAEMAAESGAEAGHSGARADDANLNAWPVGVGTGPAHRGAFAADPVLSADAADVAFGAARRAWLRSTEPAAAVVPVVFAAAAAAAVRWPAPAAGVGPESIALGESAGWQTPAGWDARPPPSLLEWVPVIPAEPRRRAGWGHDAPGGGMPRWDASGTIRPGHRWDGDEPTDAADGPPAAGDELTDGSPADDPAAPIEWSAVLGQLDRDGQDGRPPTSMAEFVSLTTAEATSDPTAGSPPADDTTDDGPSPFTLAAPPLPAGDAEATADGTRAAADVFAIAAPSLPAGADDAAGTYPVADVASTRPVDAADSADSTDLPPPPAVEPIPVYLEDVEVGLPAGSSDNPADPLSATRLLTRQLRRSRRAATPDVRAAAALHKEGAAHLRQRRTEEAIAALERLVALHPASAKAHRDLGAAYLRADRHDDAVASLAKALNLRPRFADAYASLGDAQHLLGKVDEAVTCYRYALSLKPSASRVHSNLLLTLNYHRKLDAGQIFAEHVRWAEQHAAPLAGAIAPHDNDPTPGRPLRVGYVSPDFRRHSVNYFVEPILASHDRSAVHVTCYSDVHRPDDETERIANLCDHWRDVRGMTDDELAALVREDRIDILVDLAGHTGTNRMGTFARKPAPVQVTYLGYPNTTGLGTMDYRLTDAHADPPVAAELYHTETLLRLPNFLCYRPPFDAPEAAPPPAVANGHVTFGCYNILAKVTPEALSLWAKILQVMPTARLVMKDRIGSFASAARRRYVLDILAFHRVPASRVDLLGREPEFDAHLRSYAKVDVMLDPFPYNGTTTTCESLWMGVPVVALAGARHAARAGVSVLTAAGLGELVAATPEAYARTAVLLARDVTRLGHLRRSMRDRLSASPLMDAPRFTASLERAYRNVWERWCRDRQAGTPVTTETISLHEG